MQIGSVADTLESVGTAAEVAQVTTLVSSFALNLVLAGALQ